MLDSASKQILMFTAAIAALGSILMALHMSRAADPCKKLESCNGNAQCYEVFREVCLEQLKQKQVAR